MIKTIAKLLHVLNSETHPAQISLGFCFAAIAGLTPLWSIHNIVVLLCVLILRVNLSAFLLGLAFFTGCAYLLDPLFHSIGLAILTHPSLLDIWTQLYNQTLWRLERFNNSIVMGSLAFTGISFLPLFFLSNFLIRRYRTTVLAWVQKTKIMQALKANKFYQYYESLSSFSGGAS